MKKLDYTFINLMYKKVFLKKYTKSPTQRIILIHWTSLKFMTSINQKIPLKVWKKQQNGRRLCKTYIQQRTHIHNISVTFEISKTT